MSLDKHISIATVALARGLIDSQRFVDVMHTLRKADSPPSIEEVWLEPGLLTEGQLQALLESVAGGTRRGHAGSSSVLVAATGDTLPFTAFAMGTRPQDLAAIARANTLTESEAEDAPATSKATSLQRPSVQSSPESRMVTRISDHDQSARGQSAAEEGAVVRARYERQASLGAGGLGEVAACMDSLLGRTVAVKAARAEGDRDAQAILEREARIIASLEHPNIIPVYDAGSTPGVGPYYVMRVVHQPSLDQVLDRLRREDPEASREYGLKRLLRYFVQICRAVDFAHSRGVVHCDLKPANILLGEFGEVLVVDWGLAYSAKHPEGPRGGTPGFMAPEQFDRGHSDFDARTDVFALGAILYQLVSLRQAFPVWTTGHADQTSRGEKPPEPYMPPVPPSEHQAPWPVPAEVEEICLRACALDPSERFPSARLLADAIDEYLEGTRELERRRAEADRSTETGDELAERYHEFVEQRPDELEELAELRAQTPPWAPVAEKFELWNAEDMLEVTDALRVRTMQAAQSAYEQAIETMPSHKGARRGLARLYWAELERARRERDALNQIYFEGLVRQYDDGTYLASDESEGQLVVERRTTDAHLTLCTLVEEDRQLVVGSREELELVQLSLQQKDGAQHPVSMPHRLEAGSYVIEAARAGDERPVRYPFQIRPGGRVTLVVDLAPASGQGDHELFVPAGEAQLGDTTPALGATDARIAHVDGFFIDRFPVTFADYLEFLDSLPDDELDRFVPGSSLGMPYWRREGGVWRAVSLGRGLGEERMRELPVFGVSARAAERYALWRSDKTGVELRLPRDSEWEKAARGADGRFYPWGEHFDATFCKMRQSQPGEAAPEPSGWYEADESPYGVRDMAGGIADWTLPDREAEARMGDHRAVYSRGGAWCDWPTDCRVTSRRVYLADERAQRVGFRLARSA